MTEMLPMQPVDRTPGWLKFIARYPGVVIPLILICGGLGINLYSGHVEGRANATPTPVSGGMITEEVSEVEAESSNLYEQDLPGGKAICAKADDYFDAYLFNRAVKKEGYRGDVGPDKVWVVGEDGQGEWRDAILSWWYIQSLESQGIEELCVWPSSTDN